MSRNQPDYYTILGLSREATPDQIKAAYRQLAMKYHPDKNNTTEATSKFQQIAEAYSILSDPAKKEQYDHPHQFPSFVTSGFGVTSFNLSDIFSGFGMNRPQPIVITLTYVDLIFGATKHVTVKNRVSKNADGSTAERVICSACRGQGAMLSFLGVKCSGCQGLGYQQPVGSYNETVSTDYTVIIPPDSWPDRLIECQDKVFRCVPQQTPELRNDGLNLIVTQKLPLFSALLGFNQPLSVAGKTHQISHPAVIQPNEIIRKSKAGLIGPDGQQGDLLINFIIEFPSKLNDGQVKYVKKCIRHGRIGQ